MEELFRAWAAELDTQNSILKEAGEEPLTIEEFISCRVDDVREARSAKRAWHEEAWWKTYRAAISAGAARCYRDADDDQYVEFTHDYASRIADKAHGPLKNEVQP